jgi:transcriptional regulator with XRE-family HTH domain
MEEPNDFGVAVKRFRGSRPQWKLAEAAGMTTSTWSDYERGKQKPRLAQKKRIASALGCTLEELEQEAHKVADERFAVEAMRSAGLVPDTSDSLLETTDRQLREIDESLDRLLAKKKLLLILRRYLVGLPPGTPIPEA